MFTFSTLDTYKISHGKKSEKFNIDYKVLVRLYEPIIGSVAMSLYLTLESELSLNKYNKATNQIVRLHKLMQIDESGFNDAIEALKKYGLISYKANPRKANDYLFVLSPTKPAVEFFSNEKLNNALQVIVDTTYYSQVYDYFISNIINEDEYVDIEDIKANTKMSDEEFFLQFSEKYPIISSSCALTDSVKKEIIRLKKLFNLSFDKIENALLNSIYYEDNLMIIGLDKLNDFINNKYNKKEESGESLLVKTFESERSISYYQKLANRNLFPREINMINELIDQYKISEGVLNVIINYYFTYGKTTMGVSKNYFVKIIEGMILENVKTTIDAMNYFKNRSNRIKEYKAKNNETNTQTKKVEQTQETVEEEIDADLLEQFKKALGG